MIAIRAIQGLCRLAAGAASLLLLCMAALVTADVIWDFIFGRPIRNVIEIVSVYLMVAIVFFPLGHVELKGDHIGADILIRFFPPKAKLVQNFFVTVVSIIFVSVLSYQTFLDAISAFDRNEMIMGSGLLVVWPSRFALPLGFGLLALAMLVTFLGTLLPDIHQDPDPEDEIE